MRARQPAGQGCAGDRGETMTCAAPGRREGARASRCELLTASTARDPVFEPLCAAGVVNLLALAVTFHGGGTDLDVSIYT
jgi:hypothetical protein